MLYCVILSDIKSFYVLTHYRVHSFSYTAFATSKGNILICIMLPPPPFYVFKHIWQGGLIFPDYVHQLYTVLEMKI